VESDSHAAPRLRPGRRRREAAAVYRGVLRPGRIAQPASAVDTRQGRR
jgi:hypothetical protein